MNLFRRILLVAGILGALAAAEGLNRFGTLVSSFGGADAPFYIAMLIYSVFGAGVLLLGLFNKSHSIVKWITFIGFVGCLGLMMFAPSFPVNIQIFIGLFIATFATIFIKRTSYTSN